ncbi:hypothetical protein [Gracilimonas sediminicola]|uniref:Uncharacterized protein n=1 Tax=Gracilimonas sediminicola TaxID=2952158 RepID=A0A9X2L5H9_9BACT|nr:hypothetical protein [Gracilimonas sediminicola]MCP9292726.1 hypothetical protein [Gracilimonas sediminicola]
MKKVEINKANYSWENGTIVFYEADNKFQLYDSGKYGISKSNEIGLFKLEKVASYPKQEWVVKKMVSGEWTKTDITGHTYYSNSWFESSKCKTRKDGRGPIYAAAKVLFWEHRYNK